MTIESCDGCGACCMEMGHPMFIFDHPRSTCKEQAWIDLPDDLKDEHRKYMEDLFAGAGGDDGKPCYWLDLETRKCKHYELRPGCCRDTKDGGEIDRGDVSCRNLREKYLP